MSPSTSMFAHRAFLMVIACLLWAGVALADADGDGARSAEPTLGETLSALVTGMPRADLERDLDRLDVDGAPWSPADAAIASRLRSDLTALYEYLVKYPRVPHVIPAPYDRALFTDQQEAGLDLPLYAAKFLILHEARYPTGNPTRSNSLIDGYIAAIQAIEEQEHSLYGVTVCSLARYRLMHRLQQLWATAPKSNRVVIESSLTSLRVSLERSYALAVRLLQTFGEEVE